MRNVLVFISILVAAALISTLAFLLGHGHLVLFHPAGVIAGEERHLMVLALELMLLVVVPVYLLTALIVWRYRESNARAQYLPNWEHNAVEEGVWWLVPLIIIVVLAVITWTSTHRLDPYRPLDSSVPPITVQVDALDWKWLFIYPDAGVATVNYLALPEGTPVNFEITADAPMNALWIPELGGQMMAMPGMITQLHLMADATGTYLGESSTYSGDGFAGMQFPAVVMAPAAFDAWEENARATGAPLDWNRYEALAAPSSDEPKQLFRLADDTLYTRIVMQFMAPTSSPSMPGPAMPGMQGMSGMSGMASSAPQSPPTPF